MVDFSQAKLRDDRSTERLVDLAMLLQKSTRGYTRDEIGQLVPHYKIEDADNFGRMFERDKVELMSIGFDIEVVQADQWNQDEFRYRIVSERNLLPAISFTPGEMKVLIDATAAWSATSLHDDAQQTLLKLEALGVTIEASENVARFSVEADFRKVLDAINSKRVLNFDYQKPGQRDSEKRTIQPWGLALRNQHWYLYGHDVKRNASRCFNISRVTSPFSTSGKSQAFEIPQDIDVVSLISPEASSVVPAVLKILPNTGIQWRKIASKIEEREDHDLVSVSIANRQRTISSLAADAPEVLVLEPQEIRDAVIYLLRRSS